MRGLIKIFQWLWLALVAGRKFLPVGIGILTIFIKVAGSFIKSIQEGNINIFFEETAKSILTVEARIVEIMQMAIASDPGYTFLIFLELIGLMFFVYAIIKFFGMIQTKLGGAQAWWGALLIGLGIFLILESAMSFALYAALNKELGFLVVPGKGIWMFFTNLGAVFGNIHWIWKGWFSGQEVVNTETNNSLLQNITEFLNNTNITN